jgi:molybdopterin-guanine dinucleotide biosynthesis protein A
MASIQDVSCVILAGGESKRMGADKAQVLLSGKTLLERVLEIVRPLFDDIMISGRGTKPYMEDVRFIKDRLPGRGPAVGLCSAMQEARYPHIFVIACDMPFVTSALIGHITSYRKAFDVVAPVHHGRLEPLCAMYSTACAKPLVQRVNRGERGLISFIETAPGLKVQRIRQQELMHAGRAAHLFMDIDSAVALAEAEKIIGKWDDIPSSCTDQSQGRTDVL